MATQIILSSLASPFGGAGGAGTFAGTATAGGNGTEYDGSHGSGGGGGGSGYNGGSAVVAGAGGLYGGGGGGAGNFSGSGNATSGAGKQGLIIINYVSTSTSLPVGPIYLTTTGANTYNVPSDWNSASNTVECIGGGGSGGATANTNTVATGGGGGAYSKKSNVSLTPSGTASYTVGIGGASVVQASGGTIAGNAGGDTFFNGTVITSCSCGAKGGGAGGVHSGSIAFTLAGGAGGVASSGTGDVLFSGGNAGTISEDNGNYTGTGGGGAAGLNGPGQNAPDYLEDNTRHAIGGLCSGGGADMQTYWTVPTDWNNAHNSIECIGGGAGGGAAVSNGQNAVGTGGGGGAYAKNSNVTFTSGAIVPYNVGPGSRSVNASSPGNLVSTHTANSGGDTYFNWNGNFNTSAPLLAKGGSGGTGSGTVGGAGGLASASTGTVTFSGGTGGAATGTLAALGGSGGGGGGGAGPNGAGNAGASLGTTNALAGVGGSGGNGSGGAGGSGASGGSGTTTNAGSAGTEYTTAGSGGGGQGNWDSTDATTSTAGAGGNYGAGGGGVGAFSTDHAISGVGAQGLIVITYVPLIGSLDTLKKNIAGQNMTFSMISVSNGSPLTGLSINTYVTKDNAPQSAGAGTITEKGGGQYDYSPTQAETNATDVGFLFTASGTVPFNMDFHTDVVDANGFQQTDVEAINAFTKSGINLGTSTQAICWGTVGNGSTQSSIVVSTLNNPSSLTVAGQLTGRTLLFLGNSTTLGLQSSYASITASTTGATPTLTVTPLPAVPVSGDTFVLV